jgi:pSer/pThr/pTyr-binding forkhead associated (FHA) protein
MPITVIVRSHGMSDARLTFDGLQRVVIGRGAGCDVRLPDASVSHRHACLGANGGEFVLTDEGSTNGTFVGQVRVAPRTSRIVRSGDMVRVGRIWLELRMEAGPVTRDVAAATRDLALALVSHAIAAHGKDLSARIRVVEGPDQGAWLALAEEKRAYVLGRDATCDLALSDSNVSRAHARVERQGHVVVVRDLGGKNGTWLGDTQAAATSDAVWRRSQMMRIGRTVVALEDPLCDLLANVEDAPDEAIPAGDSSSPPANLVAAARPAVAEAPARERVPPKPKRAPLTAGDLVVIAAALSVFSLSVAALVWLLRF